MVIRDILIKLIPLDRFAQDKWFGGKIETISSHLGKKQRAWGGQIPWTKHPLQAAVSRFLDWLDPGHCQKSIEKVQPKHNMGEL